MSCGSRSWLTKGLEGVQNSVGGRWREEEKSPKVCALVLASFRASQRLYKLIESDSMPTAAQDAQHGLILRDSSGKLKAKVI